MKKRLALLSATAMVAGLLALTPGTAQACGANETVSLHSYKVTMKPRAKAYKVGQTAEIDMKVVTPNDTDPADAGVPMPPETQEPAPDVRVGVGLRVGDVFLFGLGMTDENGESLIKIKLANYTPAGRAMADAFAYKNTIETACLVVQEYGYTSMPDIFKVKK